jgi:hypothetical protein
MWTKIILYVVMSTRPVAYRKSFPETGKVEILSIEFVGPT